MNVSIRRATEADAPLIQPLLHAAHRWNYAAGFNFTAATVALPEVVKRINESEVYLISADGTPEGTVTIFDDGTIGWLGVAPEAQGRGHARRLLAFAEGRIRQMGLHTAKLDTPVSHPWLPAFYQRCGYQPVGTVHWEGKRYDSVLLEKELRYPTPHPDVNGLVDTLLDGVRSALGGQFLGFYLHGSLALGDMDPARSDVDFLVVTRAELAPEATAALASMHRRIAGSDLRWKTNYEGSYIPLEAVRRYSPAEPPYPAVQVDGTFHTVRHGIDWVIQRYVVREHGVVVAGPPPSTLIDPISADDLRRATRQLLQTWWLRLAADPARLEASSEYQVYAVLTMCRALYTLQTGSVATKPAAARWARPVLGPRWHSLIDEALAWRRHSGEFSRLEEVRNLIRHAHAVSTD
ncbi:MAG TPA: GNAT family N-acetyltransferase [Symbiobacteriaceae bacterium]|nr:GNAT family N-acetyltransferase [Symbiobacteriaceae bacterium]